MSGLQYVIAAGGLTGAGLAALIWHLAPVQANLAQTLALLSPSTSLNRTDPPTRGWEAVGVWGLAKLPAVLRPIPAADLNLLSITPAGFVSRKLAYALVGLLAPGIATALALIIGWRLPWAIPVIVTLAAAGTCFMIPDLRVRSQAAAARREFSRQLACFVDLVALERSCGSGTQQALSTASEVGDSWAFRRLRECLDHATWAGIASWDGLRDLADELALPDLSDVADIIRLSGSEGAGIHRILRAKARSIRESRLTADLTQANEANESMSLPVSVLGIIFLVILIAPALLSMMGLTS